MKKILLIGLCCLCLCGCKKKENKESKEIKNTQYELLCKKNIDYTDKTLVFYSSGISLNCENNIIKNPTMNITQTYIDEDEAKKMKTIYLDEENYDSCNIYIDNKNYTLICLKKVNIKLTNCFDYKSYMISNGYTCKEQ